MLMQIRMRMTRGDRDLIVLQHARHGTHTQDAEAVARLVENGKLLLLPCDCRGELCLGRLRVTPQGRRALREAEYARSSYAGRLHRAAEILVVAGIDAAAILAGSA
jgi:hypothetical protein